MDLPGIYQMRQQSTTTVDTLDPQQKRTKERSVAQAQELVALWRKYFLKGISINDRIQKLSLQEAAIKVGVPKKTLEDYYSIFRKLEEAGINLEEYKTQRMGTLRAILKQLKDQKKPSIQYATLQLQTQNPLQQQRMAQEYNYRSTENYGDLIIEDAEFCSPSLNYMYNERVSDEVKIRRTESVIIPNEKNVKIEYESMDIDGQVNHEE